LANAIKEILEGSQKNKRNFLETVELQIGLKNYDPQRDKRFSGSYKLPNVARPNMKFCLIADAKHADIAKGAMDTVSADDLKKFNKNKKLIKKWGSFASPLLRFLLRCHNFVSLVSARFHFFILANTESVSWHYFLSIRHRMNRLA
jgi:hypothetical protein